MYGQTEGVTTPNTPTKHLVCWCLRAVLKSGRLYVLDQDMA